VQPFLQEKELSLWRKELKKSRLLARGNTHWTMHKTIKQLLGGQTQRANLIKDENGNLLVEIKQNVAKGSIWLLC
jgi:hypothetical protein